MIAIFIASFSPLYKEHIFEIVKLKRNFDKVVLIVSDENITQLDHQSRFRTLREVYQSDDLVEVHKYNNDVDFQQNIKNLHLDEKYLIYSIEPHFYELENVIEIKDFKNKEVDINLKPYENWDLINKYFKKFYTKNILIYGTASTGKTTLTKDLANYYNTSYSLEYAREYEEKYNVTDEELDIRDLTNMGIGQYNQNKEHIHSPATNKLFFADTDVMTTMCYLGYYNKEDEQFDAVNDIFSGLIRKQKWELVLFLQPDTEYVNDGFRDMTHSSEEFRKEFNDIFRSKLEEYNIDYVEITGSFEEKFLKSVEYCDALLNEETHE